MRLPLHALWRLEAKALPERLRAQGQASGFTLPGSDALADFAALLGNALVDEAAPAEQAQPGAPFTLPALLPEDVAGEAILSRTIDFGALHGDRAVLELDAVSGSGGVFLGDARVASFGPQTRPAPDSPSCAPCALAVELTDALRRGRRETLSIRFDASRPAGLPGPVMLRVTQHAHIRSATIAPDARKKTLALRAEIAAARDGAYVLTAQAAVPGHPAMPARAVRASLCAGQTHALTLEMDVPSEPFRPGQAYDASALKILLWRDISAQKPPAGDARALACEASTGPAGPGRGAALCDGTTLLFGYPGKGEPVWLPLTAAQCALAPEALLDSLRAVHAHSVLLPVPWTDALYRALTRAGVAVRQRTLGDDGLRARLGRFPCVTFESSPDAQALAPLSLAASAWRLAGMTAFLRAPEPGAPPEELLCEAAGRAVDAQDPGVRDVLLWLRALSVRLTAEAARQGRAQGALCAPGEWENPDVAEALRTALAPVHLSALPLYGAWWTGMRFSASLHAFLDPGALPAADGAPLLAQATLESEDGRILARVNRACPPSGGSVGLIEAALPAAPCVLTLSTRIVRGDEVLEQSVLPVYVGERGPLEAAFSGICA